ncbi:MAG: DUF4468 domain-containing protein [Bacteroidaceae bacterium]|nr:DUF4468 domain-containing protein [Bacteroidaceae bacterium]
MKLKLFLMASLTCIATVVMGKDDDSKYLAGAVPEENGMVVFSNSFSVEGKSSTAIHDALLAWAQQMVETSISAPGNYARIMGDENNNIEARVCEWLVMKKKTLNLDRARMRYQMSIQIAGTNVTIKISQIVYHYGEDMEGNNGVTYKAEEWISDREALNKTQTKLYPKSGKFRRKTCDRMAELFASAQTACQ